MSIKPKKKELEYSIDDLQYIWNNEDYANESASTSKRYKRNINRIFRNIIKSKRIPYPEVDNIFFVSGTNVVIHLETKRSNYFDEMFNKWQSYIIKRF